MDRLPVNRLTFLTTGVTVCICGFILVLFAADGLRAQGSTNLYLRAPDVIPGTLPEMRTPSFWIERMDHPDEPVLTTDQIMTVNREYRSIMDGLLDEANTSDLAAGVRRQLMFTPGMIAYKPDAGSFSPSDWPAVVRGIVERQISNLRGRQYGNILGIQYAEHELDKLEKEMSLDTISDSIDPQAGVTVRDSRLRIIPALRPEYIGLTQTGKTRWDVWNLDVLPIASTVHILHRSESGGHLFVLSDYGYGWVKSEDVALASQSDVEVLLSTGPGAETFIVATGDRVPFYSDSTAQFVSGWMRMGARLPVVDPQVPGVIQVPVRRLNGELVFETAWLAPDADVSYGFLAYTRKNVVEQAFKMLDNIYDWTGGWYGRNDGTVLRDVFRTFGFQMPANGVLLSAFTPNRRIVSPEGSREEQYSEIMEAEPFLTFQMSRSGHSLLYMGDYDGEPIVFDTNGYGYEDDEGRELEIRRWAISTLFVPDYFLNQEISIVEIR